MRIRKTIFAAGLMAVFAAAAWATPADFQFGLTLTPALPQGEFHDIIGKTAWGGAMQFAWRPSRSPVLIGTSLGFGIYGTDSWEAWLGLTDPDVIVNVQTTNTVLAWNVFLRLQPVSGFLRPYLDLFAGLHILSTDTRIEDSDSGDDVSGSLSINNASDAAFAFGAGAGVMFPLARFVRRDGRTAASIDLDLGARYAWGGRADYLVESEEPGIYDFRRSRTDLLTLNAGLSFNF